MTMTHGRAARGGLLACICGGLALLASCGKTDSARNAAQEAAAIVDDGTPLETRPRNALDYQPLFPGQTRARGIRTGPAVKMEVVSAALTLPFAVEPLPDGRLLVSEKPGNLRIIDKGVLSPPVDGLPAIRFKGQAGLLDIALDPQFTANHVIYFSYAEERKGGSGLALASATLVEGAGNAHLEGVKVLFRQLPVFESDRQYGARIVFAADGKLFLALGERGVEGALGQAQDLDSHFGKIVRINRDGSVPQDNPFVGRAGALPEIWSWGHRNIQAAALDASGRLWVIEHGPRGGDELNLVKPGANYGWPVITYGIDYPGTKVGEGIQQKQGMEQPVYYWDPVIAPCGMMIYSGAMFPEWKGSIFVGGLMGQRLVRLQMDGDKVVGEQWPLPDFRARIRDVQQGPDGAIYVLTEEGEHSRLLRITPAA
jgi:glucose/arabinose dehydrogenase